jgi:SAM-dependent methyltransferase
MCDAMLEEELFFRRHGRYQAQSFADVARAIYDDAKIMRLYMDGLLLSQVFWRNHVDIARFYRSYVAALPDSFDHLEIGPGHGLQLAHAALDPKCHSATGWDVSDASLAATRDCLRRLDVSDAVTLEKRSIFDLGSSPAAYSSVVVSEVLEHLEDPAGALSGIRRCLLPGGRGFLNVPCNSPAPDHIHLFSHPDDFFRMVENAGLVILERYATPGTGTTMERALRHKLTISCAAIVTLDERE